MDHEQIENQDYARLLGRIVGSNKDGISTRSAVAQTGDRAVTLQRTSSDTGLTDPIPLEPAFVITMQLAPMRKAERWSDTTLIHSAPLAAGDVVFSDLRENPSASCSGPLECVHFYFQHDALAELAEIEDRGAFAGLDLANNHDPVLMHLARAFRHATDASPDYEFLALDQYLLAAGLHITERYGTRRTTSLAEPAALDAGILARAKEALANLDTHTPDIMRIATDCGLPPSYFIRAFERSTGMTPARWVRQHRVEEARALLFGSKLSLAQIAHVCGFSDQSHFTRCFNEATGYTPSAWRRARRF